MERIKSIHICCIISILFAQTVLMAGELRVLNVDRFDMPFPSNVTLKRYKFVSRRYCVSYAGEIDGSVKRKPCCSDTNERAFDVIRFFFKSIDRRRKLHVLFNRNRHPVPPNLYINTYIPLVLD